jgi:hypothetical protein
LKKNQSRLKSLNQRPSLNQNQNQNQNQNLSLSLSLSLNSLLTKKKQPKKKTLWLNPKRRLLRLSHE